MGGTGSSETSALCFGGEDSTTAHHVVTETWNGTNWTEVNDMSTARHVDGGMLEQQFISSDRRW